MYMHVAFPVLKCRFLLFRNITIVIHLQPESYFKDPTGTELPTRLILFFSLKCAFPITHCLIESALGTPSLISPIPQVDPKIELNLPDSQKN